MRLWALLPSSKMNGLMDVDGYEWMMDRWMMDRWCMDGCMDGWIYG